MLTHKKVSSKSEQEIINDLQFILQFTKLDQNFIRQYSAFFTNIHWKLIACCQKLSDDFMLEFRKYYEEIYQCDDFRAIKRRVDMLFEITRMKNVIND